jgi:hypothetical protein
MPLVDGISRKALEVAALEALIDANTLAAGRVYEPRDWPTRPELFPLLIVTAPRERKMNFFPGQPAFTTTISLVVVGRVMAPTSEAAYEDLDTLSGQIEDALMFTPSFASAIQQFASIDTQMTVSAEGKHQIGEIGVTFDLVVYQAFGPRGTPLVDVASTLQPVGGSAVPPPINIDNQTST